MALAWGFAAVVLFNGILAGMGSDFIRSGTDLMAGQIRIQNPGYEPERELWDVVGGDAGVPVSELLSRIRSDPEVLGASPRVYGAGIIASDSTSRGGLFLGIVRTGIPELDAAQVVLHLDDLQFLLALGADAVHEVAVAVRSPWDAPVVADRLTPEIADLGGEIEVKPWTEFRPELVEFASLISGMNWVILIVVFLMAAFGVANTMLMGTFERRREFAVVKAVGMSPGRIVAMVMGEALVLGLLAVVADALISLPLVLFLIHYPIDLTPIAGEQVFMDALFRFVLRVEHSWDIPLRGAVGLVLTAVLAALYPALRAIRVPAAEALAGR